MGHFSMTCSVSGLPISGGTPVRCLLLVSSPYDERGCVGTGLWVARTPPLRAVYNDYGTIEKVHKEDKYIADLWLRGLKEDLVVKGVGDNSYHDLPTEKDMSFEELLEALRSGRVEVHQDGKHFWRRPTDDSWMTGLKDESLPMYKRIEKILAPLGKVTTKDSETDTYTVDEPVPNLVRVRFGKYQHDDAYRAALDRAKEIVEKAGFTGTIAAGSGRYPDDADLIVMNPPNKEKHFRGAQWDMATGQKGDDDRRLSVRLAMVREDVWQEMIAYPRSQYVGLDCTMCGQSPAYHDGKSGEKLCPNKSINDQPFKKHKKGATYTHGPVFPEGVEHTVTTGGYGSEYVWYGLAAFKANIRKAWKEILAYFDRQAKIERGEHVRVAEKLRGHDKKSDAAIDKLLASFEAKRKEEKARIAALPKEEQDKIKAEQKAQAERYEKAREERLANPVFGDFLISDFVLPHRYDDVGTWIFRHELPGVLGIPEHLSMCLADKTEVSIHLLDALSELAAFQYAMRDVGCVWKPASSTGPQDPEWKEQIRFHATLLKVSRKQNEKYIEDMDSEDKLDLPSNIGEAIERFKAPKKKSKKS